MLAMTSVNTRPAGFGHSGIGASKSSLPGSFSTGLSDRDLAEISRCAPTVRTLQAGEALYLQGDNCPNIYMLHSGWAFRHQNLDDGRRQIFDFSLPGSIFGFPSREIMSHSVEALSPCTFAVFTRTSFYDLLTRVPSLSVRLAEHLACSEALALEHLTSIGRRTARGRVANFLLELLSRARRAGMISSSTRLRLPLTLSHIADALGLAGETVCRTLSALRKEKIIAMQHRELTVLDVAALAVDAGVEMDDPKPWELAPPLKVATARPAYPLLSSRAGPGQMSKSGQLKPGQTNDRLVA